MMKIKLLYLLPMLALLFSCENSEPDLSTFELSKTLFTNVNSDGDVLTVSITGNASWTASSDVVWCKVNTEEGVGNDELTLSIGTNIDEEEREATVTVRSGKVSKAIQINQQAGAEYQYKIPVIFHVLYKDKADKLQYVKEGRLAEILDVVNRLYVDGNNSVNMNLKFVLAEKHPETGDRLPEVGVNRVPWETKELDCNEFMMNNDGTYTPLLWDPNDYINVFLYNFTPSDGSFTTLGVSHLPYTTAANFLDGLNETKYEQIALKNLRYPHSVSINSLYVYEQSDNEIYNLRDITVTLAHELGHYLGLFHTFSEGDKGNIDLCADTDYCDDTPTYNRKEYDDFLSTLGQSSYHWSELVKRTSCSGETFTSHNIMDYVYSYTNQFTYDQRTRIRHVLTYSPLIPRPQKGQTKAGCAPQGFLDLPIRTMK